MANICSINIYLPLEKVPDDKEREQLKALFEAEKKWDEAVKKDDSLRMCVNRDKFLASQPGVPFKRTEYKYEFFDEEDKEGLAKQGELKPDSEQWNQPTINASFKERDGKIWVYPYDFGRSRGLLFDEDDGISFHIPRADKNAFLMSYIPMTWSFKHSFPWWAQIGFAGGEKFCDQEAQDPPKGKDEKFYEEWINKHGEPMAYLLWKLNIEKVLKNLEYCIKVYENFPVTGSAWQMSWVWRELDKLKDIYKWMKQIYSVSSEAIAYLDWSEVAWNSGEFEWTQKDDSPNNYMLSIKEMEIDTKRLNEGKLSSVAFKRKNALYIRRSDKDYKGYIPMNKRDPFNYYEW